MITFVYDGQPCMSVATPPALPANLRQPNPFLIALAQALGVGVNANYTSAPVPGTEQIDYVRVWR